MYRIRILSVGKTKEAWLEEALAEYLKRLQPVVAFEFVWAKTDDQLMALASKESSLICLDASGKSMDSEKFSAYVFKQLEAGGARLTFVIGGADGLPASLKAAGPLLSFSPMTFTHQMIRLLLIEQIYRAFEIHRGSKYHRGELKS